MRKGGNMLRTRRRDNNVKPNRRLDRRSSRGMIFENEELRLKTININAEVERGHSDIKKLKRENDQLRREIWYLRDEYDKLDKLLRRQSDSSCSSESETCSSCSEEGEGVETSQNLENVQKINLNRLNQEFDHLSVVTEENSLENSDTSPHDVIKDIIKPDQSYPTFTPTVHFFSPLPQTDIKLHSDLLVKTDNCDFTPTPNGFCNGGNLEDLLNDIEAISHDILEISEPSHVTHSCETTVAPPVETFKSELNVALMPTPMTLIGTDKYKQLQKSCENIRQSQESLGGSYLSLPNKCEGNYVMCGGGTSSMGHLSNPFFFGQLPPSNVDNGELYNTRYNPETFNEIKPEVSGSKTNLLEVTSSENEEKRNNEDVDSKSPKLGVRRKMSIHFKGKKDKPEPPTCQTQKDETIATPCESKTSDNPKTSSSSEGRSRRKSLSQSPERKDKCKKDNKCHRKHKKDKKRMNPFLVDRCHRERSFSICTDRSNILDHRYVYDDTNSERERTNSVSSCETNKGRNINLPRLNEKIPWCGCWGNGCL